VTRAAALLLVALLFPPAAASAQPTLAPGFSAEIYVTGVGFGSSPSRAFEGFPAASTMAFDDAGTLYLARTGRRYGGGQVDDRWPIYRIPAGGARLTPDNENRFFHGPPLPSPQVAAIRGGREIFVTTYDRDRKIGVLYRLLGSTIELFAGGTPPPGTEPLLRQPEGAAVDAAGHVYVADRAAGRIVKLDPHGRVLDPQWLRVTRPRTLAMGEQDHLWVGSDGAADAPWGTGQGEIWRVSPDGAPSVVLRGPIAAAISVGPGGRLFVADRQAGQIFALSPEGERTELVRFSSGDAPRGLCFAPDTPATRRAGIAGDLFVALIRRGAWPLNEVVRLTLRQSLP
jgi:sugar lactone lactonase YvrE